MVLAVVLLFITPLAVANRVTPIRNELTNVTGPARVALNDLEAGFASQLLVRGHEIAANDSAAVATREHLDHDERELEFLVPQMGLAATAQLHDLSTLVRDWLADGGAGAARSSAVRARDVFATAERLDSLIVQRSNAQRAETRRLEHYNVVAAAVLAPIALFSILLIIWAGNRVQSFANAAARERAEVLRAADARAALLRGVTHDVKNPLGAAAGYAQLLEEGLVGPLTEPQRQMMRRIQRLVGMSVQTITDLLELARADAGGLHLEYAETDLAPIAAEVVDDHQGAAREHSVTIEAANESAPIVTDPLRVRQILSNLVSNAIKYTPAGGSVAVRVVHEPNASGGRVGVEVRDTGPGIPAELRSHVFEEFFRVRPATEAARGNGLGLAISRRIARLLGGDVTYSDAKPHGSIFTLWLEPRDRSSAATPARSRDGARPPDPSPAP
ncbi:MAG: sensor histidine kinase [Gemmatimonadales bacterium]